MKKITNSDIIEKIIVIIITIAARRTSATAASAFMEAILKTLERKYRFLKYITVKNIAYFEGDASDALDIKRSQIDNIDPEEADADQSRRPVYHFDTFGPAVAEALEA